MQLLKHLIAASFFACALADCAQAQTASVTSKRPMTVEDLWAVKRIATPALSPDGRFSVVELTSYSMEDNKSTSDLWLLSTDGKIRRQLTFHPANDSDPHWSPDGRYIAFTSKREDDAESQIYLISPEGGEARRLTKIATGAGALKWFKDGKRIAFISSVWPDLKTDEEQAKRLKERQQSKVKAYTIDQGIFRFWDNWLADGREVHLFVAAVETGKYQDLLAGRGLRLLPYDVSSASYDLSPDGQEVALMVDQAAVPGTDTNSGITVFDLRSGKSRSLTTDNPTEDVNPRYSPDGRTLAYTRILVNSGSELMRVVLYNRDKGTRRAIAEDWDRSVSDFAWSPDSQKLYVQAEDKARLPLWVLDLKTETREIILPGTVQSFGLSRDGKTLAFTRTTVGQPPVLLAASASGSDERSLESFNQDLVSQWQLGKVEEVTYPGWNKEPVQMWVIYPPDFDPKRRWPLLQVIHGGPHISWQDQYHFRWNLHLLASRGYVVAVPNYHGSTSWGRAFADSIIGDYGPREMEDVERGTDYLLATGYIDPKRLSAAGGSYGGYMVAWMNGHSQRYKAYVCHAGVYNWSTEATTADLLGSEDPPRYRWPWNDPQRWAKQSPHTYAKNFKTPTLVIHGEKDFRVPLAQALDYYTTLNALKVPSRLVYFPDENHWILKPQNSRFWYSEVFTWLDKYVSSGPTK